MGRKVTPRLARILPIPSPTLPCWKVGEVTGACSVPVPKTVTCTGSVVRTQIKVSLHPIRSLRTPPPHSRPPACHPSHLPPPPPPPTSTTAPGLAYLPLPPRSLHLSCQEYRGHLLLPVLPLPAQNSSSEQPSATIKPRVAPHDSVPSALPLSFAVLSQNCTLVLDHMQVSDTHPLLQPVRSRGEELFPAVGHTSHPCLVPCLVPTHCSACTC